MLTDKDYCDYETCAALKELGYKGTSRFFYATKESPLRRYSYDQILTTRIADAVGHTLAISLYSAQKWLREEKNIGIDIRYFSKTHYVYDIYAIRSDKALSFGHIESDEYAYEEALLEGIKEAIKLLKEERK